MTLLLTRREHESIVIIDPLGNQIVMTAEAIHRGQVRLRYFAPSDYQIWQDELLGGLDKKHKKYTLPPRKRVD